LRRDRPHHRLRMKKESGRSAYCGMPPISKRKPSCSARSPMVCASSATSKGAMSSSSTLSSTRNTNCSLAGARPAQPKGRRDFGLGWGRCSCSVQADQGCADCFCHKLWRSGEDWPCGEHSATRRQPDGLTLFAPEMTSKHLELLREIV